MSDVRPVNGELPLRVIEKPEGIVLVCLCGAESAMIRSGAGNHTMVGLRSSGVARPHLAADLTPAGLMRIVLHARTCLRGENLAAELGRPAAEPLVISGPPR